MTDLISEAGNSISDVELIVNTNPSVLRLERGWNGIAEVCRRIVSLLMINGTVKLAETIICEAGIVVR